MRPGRLILSMVLLLVVGVGGLPAQQIPPDSIKRDLVREMLALTGAGEAMLQTVENQVPMQQRAMPTIPAVFWERFVARLRQRLPEFVEALVPIYAELFSIDDLRAFIAFYKTPAGTRLLAAQGQLIQASMEAGEQWGIRLGSEVAAELEGEGVRVN